VASVENIKFMCAPGYPMSGATAAFTVAHQVKTAAIQRKRFVTTGVTVPVTNADLPSDPSATTSGLRT
jgi:hypothetical protein